LKGSNEEEKSRPCKESSFLPEQPNNDKRGGESRGRAGGWKQRTK